MFRNESARVSLKGRQGRWHCNDCSGLPSIHPTFSLEHIGRMPSKGLDASRSLPAFKFCDQVCGLAICPTPASGWGLGKALVQSGHEETSLWLSLWRPIGYLGRADFIFFPEHLSQKSCFLQKNSTDFFFSFIASTSTPGPQGLVASKCPHVRSVAEVFNWYEHSNYVTCINFTLLSTSPVWTCPLHYLVHSFLVFFVGIYGGIKRQTDRRIAFTFWSP